MIRIINNNWTMIRKSYQAAGYGFMKSSPRERLSPTNILKSLTSRGISSKMVNNGLIAVNCTKIAIKYSKCYLCRLPGIRGPIRKMYNIASEHERLGEINQLFLEQCPLPKFAPLFKNFNYENKGNYLALSVFLVQPQLTRAQHDQAIKFITALELVNLGYTLHHSVGKSYKLNFATRMALKLMSKQMKDSYLVLGGDYFHIKGSVLASEAGKVRLSQILSEVEIDLCKYVYKVEELKSKIREKGYSQIQIEEIHNISILKTSPLVKGLMGLGVIEDSSESVKNKEVYECLGLLILYRRDLQEFMFNFKSILSKYAEYTLSKNHNELNCEESLPYFIFFKGAQDERIDISYLNTVTLMSQEIEYLSSRLADLTGADAARSLQNRLNYYLMICS